MKTGANLLEFGKALDGEIEKITSELPVGVGVHRVADQAVVVEEAVGGFTKALFEAVAIVLVVSFRKSRHARRVSSGGIPLNSAVLAAT